MKTIASQLRRIALVGMAGFVAGGCENADVMKATAPEMGRLVDRMTMTAVSPTEQQGPAGQLVAETPTVQILTSSGVPAPDVQVRFDVMTGGGSVSPRYVRTDASGHARADWRLGPEPGTNRLQAAVPRGGPRVVFNANGVSAQAPRDLEISPGTVALEAVGATAPLTAVVFDEGGMSIEAPVVWSSSNTAVATVDGAGLVIARSNGETRIVAVTSNNVADTAHVTVTQRVVALAIAPRVDTIDVGTATRLLATATDANGNSVADADILWSSERPSIASVDATGLVTGLVPGEATILATGDGQSGSATIVVRGSAPPPTGRIVLFSSDWSSGLGSAPSALMDQAGGTPWTMSVGNGRMNTVVSTGHGMPSANAMRVIGDPNDALDGVQSQFVRVTGLPVPAVGETIFYRWYMSVDVPDEVNASPGGHPIQDGLAGSQTNWMFNTRIRQDGTWQPTISVPSPTWPYHKWVLRSQLAKRTVYRIELAIRRTGLDTFAMEPRVYDVNGRLLFGPADWHPSGGASYGNLASEPIRQHPIRDASALDGLNVGTNGPRNSWTGLMPGVGVPYYTYGAVAVCSGTWCGAYNAAEGI